MPEDDRPHEYEGIIEDPPQWADESGNPDEIVHVPEEPVLTWPEIDRRKGPPEPGLIFPPGPVPMPVDLPGDWPEPDYEWQPDYSDPYVPPDERARIPVSGNPIQVLEAIAAGLKIDKERTRGTLPGMMAHVDMLITIHAHQLASLEREMNQVRGAFGAASAARHNAQHLIAHTLYKRIINHLTEVKRDMQKEVQALAASEAMYRQSIVNLRNA